MAKFPFCCTIKDIDTGIITVADLEVFIEIDTDASEPEILAVWDYDGKVRLTDSKDKFTEWLCQRVMDAAEHDLDRRGALFTAVMDRVEEDREYQRDEYADFRKKQLREQRA